MAPNELFIKPLSSYYLSEDKKAVKIIPPSDPTEPEPLPASYIRFANPTDLLEFSNRLISIIPWTTTT